MAQPKYELPWRMRNDVSAAADVLEAIELAFHDEATAAVSRSSGRVNVGWQGFRMFFREGIQPSGQSEIQWGYLEQLPVGTHEVVVDRWSLQDHNYTIIPNLAPDGWSQGLIRMAMEQTLKTIQERTDASLTDGVVISGRQLPASSVERSTS